MVEPSEQDAIEPMAVGPAPTAPVSLGMAAEQTARSLTDRARMITADLSMNVGIDDFRIALDELAQDELAQDELGPDGVGPDGVAS